jgi:FKBP-type peptidyl-prolyl cis-trans isomerase FkpA
MKLVRIACAGLAVAAFTLIPHTLMAQSALETGKAFLAENAKKEGVKTTPSGLQYIVLKEGSGKSPKATDVVLVHYAGTLLNGKEFDSSYKRGEPISFPLNQVIPGWTEGVQLMKEGAKYKFFIPSNLAYGPRGAGGLIGPDETLIFEVELLKVQ